MFGRTGPGRRLALFVFTDRAPWLRGRLRGQGDQPSRRQLPQKGCHMSSSAGSARNWSDPTGIPIC
jgi:hypothetical protein